MKERIIRDDRERSARDRKIFLKGLDYPPSQIQQNLSFHVKGFFSKRLH